MLSLQIAAAQTGVHNSIVWNFMSRRLRIFPYKLQMRQQITDYDKLNRTYFPQYSQNELKHFTEVFSSRLIPSISVNLHFADS